jgi:hypothetical protein
MWLDDGASFAVRHGLPQRISRWLQCTAEHLQARRDGGADSPNNIVAACHCCNLRRHRGRKIAPTPKAYQSTVRKRVARGRWHLPQVFQQGLVWQEARAIERDRAVT